MKIFQSLNDPEVVALLQRGAVGVLPSDTVYGLMARAADEQAVARIYRLKQRENRPGTLVAANLEQLVGLGLKRRYLKPVEQYWPGAVSVLIPHPEHHYLVDTTSGAIAVRIPDYPELHRLMEQTGALQTSSANISGEPVVTTLAQAQAVFGDKVDFYVNGGDLSGRPPSTVIRIVDDAIEVIREGAVAIDESGRIIK